MGPSCSHCGQVHDAYALMCPMTGRPIERRTEIDEDELVVGSIIAERYRVSKVLGQGSTGTVFAVEHVNFARPAAMKVLRARHASTDLIHRVFHGEARAAWTVSHPSLCEVFDIGALPDGAPFFVMEHLEGESLATRLSREPMSIPAAVDIMMQLLSAIAAIHGRDLLLRDLRPQNVFLTARRGCRPVVKVLDFGLSRLVPLEKIQEEWDTSSDPASAPSGAIPFYLSPERTRGEHGVQPASDLFVASAIFYEMLSGVRPFTATSYSALLMQIARGKAVPLQEVRPEVPFELGAFVARALLPDPRARPASAMDMQDELRALFDAVRRDPPVSVGSERPPRESRDRGLPRSSPTAVAVAAGAPRERGPARRLPSGSMKGVANLASSDDVYSEETETHKHPHRFLMDSKPEADIDEASADHPLRTQRPPEPESTGDGLDIEVAFDEASLGEPDTETGGVLPGTPAGPAPASGMSRSVNEDEETETMRLTPELKERLEKLSAGARPAKPSRR